LCVGEVVLEKVLVGHNEIFYDINAFLQLQRWGIIKRFYQRIRVQAA